MIHSFSLLPGQKIFTNKLYKHKNKEVTFNFEDSINVITGPNGSGKSVLLHMIATKCGIGKESSYACMPSPSRVISFFDEKRIGMEELIENRMQERGFPSTNIRWDGSIVHHLNEDTFDSTRMWNRYNDHSFRPDKISSSFNGADIINKIMVKDSRGEAATRILFSLNTLTDKYNDPIDKKSVNSLWVEADNIYQEWHGAFLKKGKPTLLIDELDSGLDLINQYYYWKFLEDLSVKWQIIVVSHSIFAFKYNGNQLPLSKKYFKDVNKLSF